MNDEWLSLTDAMAVFCEAWEESPLRGSAHSSARLNGVNVRLVGGLSAVWSELQARCWCGEVECRTRCGDPTAQFETLPAKALHHFRIVDFLGEVIAGPTGERFYEPSFRRSLRIQLTKEPATAAPVAWRPDWLAIKSAAAEMGVHRDTMERWCKQHGIGSRIGGRWQVDRQRLDAFVKNAPFPRLTDSRPAKLA